MAKKKKSYNPFKMWGSYVGLIIGFLLTFMGNIFTFPSNLFILPVGFLIGWGVNVMLRKTKSKLKIYSIFTILLIVFLIVANPSFLYFNTATIKTADITFNDRVWDTYIAGARHPIGFCFDKPILRETGLIYNENIYIYKYLGLFRAKWCDGNQLV